MEETAGRSGATTPSPVTVPATIASSSSGTGTAGADVFPSPPRNQQQQQPPSTTTTIATTTVASTTAAANPAPVRILGRNVNGTVVQTSMPQNEAELQLYRVMQRASLLSYYDTLLEMGGDDVQQLCDAGEEEFLEIMALVGMASKPLHVRRLQKALQEWLTNPGMFQTPVLAPPAGSSTSGTKKPAAAAAAAAVIGSAVGPAAAGVGTPVVFPVLGSYSPTPRPQQQQQPALVGLEPLPASSSIAAKLHSSSTSSSSSSSSVPAATSVQVASCPATPPTASLGCQFPASTAATGCCPLQRRRSLSPPPGLQPYGQQQTHQHHQAGPTEASAGLPSSLPLSHSPGLVQTGNYESSSCGSQGTTPSPSSNCAIAPHSPTMLLMQTTPILLESQVQRLAELAEKIAAKYRPVNPKPPSGIKKKISKNLEMVIAMPDSDPRKMEEIRKYAAIYGRFDCKRKPEKPLTLHEVSVNEAAAQICRFVPILLTRRDELFPLARQIVRDSGHYFTKSLLHSSSSNTSPRRLSSRENGDGELSGGDEASSLLSSSSGLEPAKKRRLELRCPEDESAANNGEHNTSESSQADTARLRCINFARSLAIDSDNISIQVHQNRHRKRQRRRRPVKIGHKSTSSPIWQSCSDSGNIVLDGVVEGLEDSDGCYSSFEDDWNDCNDDDCDDNFGIESDDGAGDNDDETDSTTVPLIHDTQVRPNIDEDDPSCLIDKENDFNLKVIASCGDNIIAVANPALMNRNQSAAITKEQTMKEEVALRDRRD